MLRSAGIFLAAILLPSVALAWLAVRSAHDQEILLQHQQAIICQDVTDSLAKSERSQVDLVRSEFVQITQDLLSKSASPLATASSFDHVLRAQWPPAEIGFAVDLRGAIYSPGRSDGPAARMFYEENERFLTNREFVEVYSSFKSQSLVARQPVPPAQAPVAGLAATLTNAQAQRSMFFNQAAGNLRFDENSNADADAAANAKPVTSGSFTDALNADNQANALRSKSAYAAAGASARDSVQRDQSSLSGSMESELEDKSEVEKAAKAQVIATQSRAMQTSAVQAEPDVSTASLAPAPAPTPESASAPMDAGKETTASVTSATTNAPMPTLAAQTRSLPPPTDLALAVPSQKISQMMRNVAPQNAFNVDANAGVLSSTIPIESDFRRLIGTDTSGVLARFLDNKMRLMVWYRPTATDNLVFGAQLDQARILDRLRAVLQSPEFTQSRSSLGSAVSYCLVLLDDTGKPVALSIPGFAADWKHPFVATEIGDALPHWEATLYLTDPGQISKSARTLRLTISLIVLLLLVAIVAGGSLIASDVRRQMRLAQQKTDFVSNVSHELKTPLTSIRMFADLLAEGRVDEPERQATYLKIISAESARLTRLINNVLDFARLERGSPDGERRPCDLVEIARDVIETCLPHLEANGQHLTCEIEADSLPVMGDRDALAQVILNLVSNAEKYGGGEIEVRVRRQETTGGALGCIDVLDRGPGVPPRQVEAIFLPFHRLHNSLSTGVPGSGLGLTLARRMARAHRGNITYTARAGGGSSFTLAIPLTDSSS